MNRWQGYQTLVFVLPLPFAGNVDWAWSLYCAACFILLALELRSRVTHMASKQLTTPKLPITLIKARPIIALLLGAQAIAACQLIFNTSLASHNSYLYLLKGLALTLFIPLSFLMLESKLRINRIIWVVIIAAAFQAIYGAVMVLTGLEWGFFINKPSYLGKATGTFISRNHFAGYLEICIAVGVGCLLAQGGKPVQGNWRQRLRHTIEVLLSPKIIMRLLLAIMVIALVLSRSRMGNSAFFASLLITGALALLLMKNKSRSTTILLSSLLIIDISIVGTFFGVEKVAQRLQATTSSKESRDEVSRDTFNLWQQYPIMGIGAGSYEHVYPSNKGDDIPSTQLYNHAHNDYLQFLVEYGVLAFSLMAAAVLWCLIWAVQAMRLRRSDLHKGLGFSACMGIIALLIHSAVDFNLQIPANSFMFMFMLVLACIARWGPSEKSRRRRG
jgi:O-antigen ligase